MFRWSWYLVLAEELAARTGDEAALRSAMSRAYYVAYCTARDRLARGRSAQSTPSGDAHQVVWETYRHRAGAENLTISIQGKRLRTFRNQADYDANVPRLQSLVVEALEAASEIFRLLA